MPGSMERSRNGGGTGNGTVEGTDRRGRGDRATDREQ